MIPCYIAGPYAAPTVEERERNVARAVLLGRLACESGLAPIVTHAMGAADVFGAADEGDGSRERALQCGEAIARAVAEAGGSIWIIAQTVQALSATSARPEGVRYQLSAGSSRELDAYLAAVFRPRTRVQTWDAWGEILGELRLPPDHPLRRQYEALR